MLGWTRGMGSAPVRTGKPGSSSMRMSEDLLQVLQECCSHPFPALWGHRAPCVAAALLSRLLHCCTRCWTRFLGFSRRAVAHVADVLSEICFLC